MGVAGGTRFAGIAGLRCGLWKRLGSGAAVGISVLSNAETQTRKGIMSDNKKYDETKRESEIADAVRFLLKNIEEYSKEKHKGRNYLHAYLAGRKDGEEFASHQMITGVHDSNNAKRRL